MARPEMRLGPGCSHLPFYTNLHFTTACALFYIPHQVLTTGFSETQTYG